jgi:hypothetical protein
MKLHSDVGYNHEGIACTYFLINFSFPIQLKKTGSDLVGRYNLDNAVARENFYGGLALLQADQNGNLVRNNLFIFRLEITNSLSEYLSRFRHFFMYRIRTQ